MPISIEGKYVLTSSENFDEYLKSCGVSYFMRTIAGSATPTIQIYKDGDTWVITTVISIKTIEIKFKLGEEFEADYPDGSGRKVNATVTLEGNKLIQVQKTSDGETLSDIREFTEDGMIIQLDHDGIKCTRVYQRIE